MLLAVVACIHLVAAGDNLVGIRGHFERAVVVSGEVEALQPVAAAERASREFERALRAQEDTGREAAREEAPPEEDGEEATLAAVARRAEAALAGAHTRTQVQRSRLDRAHREESSARRAVDRARKAALRTEDEEKAVVLSAEELCEQPPGAGWLPVPLEEEGGAEEPHPWEELAEEVPGEEAEGAEDFTLLKHRLLVMLVGKRISQAVLDEVFRAVLNEEVRSPLSELGRLHMPRSSAALLRYGQRLHVRTKLDEIRPQTADQSAIFLRDPLVAAAHSMMNPSVGPHLRSVEEQLADDVLLAAWGWVVKMELFFLHPAPDDFRVVYAHPGNFLRDPDSSCLEQSGVFRCECASPLPPPGRCRLLAVHRGPARVGGGGWYGAGPVRHVGPSQGGVHAAVRRVQGDGGGHCAAVRPVEWLALAVDGALARGGRRRVCGGASAGRARRLAAGARRH